MATLAALWNRWSAVNESERTAEQEQVRPVEALGRLRPFPNEDVCFFVKRIDNTRVVRAADPRAGRTCWKVLGLSGLVTMLVIGLSLPSAYGLLAGHEIETLKAEQARLQDERTRLDLEEARLLDPARLEQLAQAGQLVEPSAASVIYLNPDAEGTLAMNTPARGK